MRTTHAVLGLFVALGLVACEQQLPTDATDASSTAAITSVDAPTLGNQVVDKVSAGSNDACAAFNLPNGCDANWSLTARMKEDGTVSGQYNDNFRGSGGVHGEIDCLNVSGNGAVVGGVVTTNGPDQGARFITALVDNGTSAGDPPDQISFTFGAGGGVDQCHQLSPNNFPLFDLTTGQVKVWDN